VATPARLAGVGVFVIGGLLLFTVGLFMIGDRQMAFARKFTLYTEFTKITGLQKGTIVRVSGAKAGSVRDIQVPLRPGSRFRVKLEVTEDLHPIVRADSLASIQTEGLVGGTYLAIGAGTAAAAPLPENATIPSQEPFEIADLMKQMGETVKKVNETIDLLAGDVLDTIQAIQDTVENANQLVTDVSDDVKTMATAGGRITKDAAEIADNIRNGKGTLGKLLNDDELYRHITAVAQRAEQIATDARHVVEEARKAVQGLQSKNGPIQNITAITANMTQTLDQARAAMTGFAENMDALKRNFLVRGFFNQRGYFDLAQISPAEYRKGKLTAGSKRQVIRVWLSSAVLFEVDPDTKVERLSDDGKARLDSALAPFLDRMATSVLVVEGYSQLPTIDQQFLESRSRAAMAREYLIVRFHLDPQEAGVMPLGHESPGSPGNTAWDGIALAVFVEKG
jgi:phospholipid/cholesterol/gamma-HCH transport system substrate-binding protein